MRTFTHAIARGGVSPSAISLTSSVVLRVAMRSLAAKMARLAVATTVALGACAGEGRALVPTAGTDAAVEGAVVDSSDTDAPAFVDAADGAPEECRWQGYGIGELGRGQCDTQHLESHSALQCFGVGGTVTASRDIPDQCVDQADEVQVLCCFAAGSTPPPNVQAALGSLDEIQTQRSTTASREDLLAEAARRCVQDGLRLGDWSMIYGPDGTTPEAIRFSCGGGGAASDAIPTGWTGAQMLMIQQSPCVGDGTAPPRFDVTEMGGAIAGMLKDVLFRNLQSLYGYVMDSGATTRVLVQPCDLHPTNVPKSDCAYDVTFTLAARADRTAVEVYKRFDFYGASKNTPPVPMLLATVPVGPVASH